MAIISKPVAGAQEQVAAMDRHVRALEARLGQPVDGKVHWARGRSSACRGKAIFGLCMGSLPGENPARQRGFGELDRHEVAHCVITSLCNAGSDPLPCSARDGPKQTAVSTRLRWHTRLAGISTSL